MLVLYVLILKISSLRADIKKKDYEAKIKLLKKLPEAIRNTLSTESDMEEICDVFSDAKGTMFLGRGYSYPIAMEGALKLKELCYVHAEGYPAGEMKHGPLALIESGMPVVIIAPRDKYYEKTLSNMQEVIARGAKVLFISNKSKDEISSDNVWKKIEVEKTSDELLPFLLTIPLQLLAFYAAKNKGYDIDKPRNLAKSVTVE
jgi:glucosamine--fructose-6-phosphate aminotransferase (isomerizing)